MITIRRNGKPVDAVAMASKTGYMYVFDRVTGKPIWPIEERPVPQATTVPGETLWPTQPFPTNPPPFSRQKFTADDLNPHLLTPEEREEYRQRILRARNEGPFTPIGFDEVIHMPGNQGGSNWGSTASNPGNGSVYVIGFNVPTIIRLLKPGETRAGRRGGPREVVQEGRYVTEGFGLYPTIISPPYTTLTAYDLNRGSIKWQIGLGDDLRLVDKGVKGTGAAATVKGGIITTATGLLFVTAADRKVHVYDAATGVQVFELPLGGPTSGAPSMYELGGRQYPARHGDAHASSDHGIQRQPVSASRAHGHRGVCVATELSHGHDLTRAGPLTGRPDLQVRRPQSRSSRVRQLPTSNYQHPKSTSLGDDAFGSWELGVGNWELGVFV